MRLDQYLVQQKLAPSRTKAKELIESGQVLVEVSGHWLVKESSSFQFDANNSRVKISDNELLRFVSRAGLKLESALKRLKLDLTGYKAVDIGQSTGGFTHCLLENAVAEVVGVDVGRDQLAPSLRGDSRVICFEGLNARDLEALGAVKDKGPFELVVMDLSFISMTKILPSAHFLLSSKGLLLSLVKPQFELDPKSLNKKAVVKDLALHQRVEQEVRAAVSAAGFEVLDYFASALKGRDGNQEFFVFSKKST